MSIALTLTTRLRLAPPAYTVRHDGVEYVLTLDTGERSYGRDGGRCAFAYAAEDVEAWLGGAVDGADYSAFCASVEPCEDRALAVDLAARWEMRLTRAGSCNPVLSDDEYALVRATVEAVS